MSLLGKTANAFARMSPFFKGLTIIGIGVLHRGPVMRHRLLVAQLVVEQVAQVIVGTRVLREADQDLFQDLEFLEPSVDYEALVCTDAPPGVIAGADRLPMLAEEAVKPPGRSSTFPAAKRNVFRLSQAVRAARSYASRIASSARGAARATRTIR